jgi:signal transduction histidine kinase
VTLALVAMAILGLGLCLLGGLGLAFERRRRREQAVADELAPETFLGVFELCFVAIDGDRVTLVAGRESLEALGTTLGVDGLDAILDELAGQDPRLGERLTALRTAGEAFELETADGLSIAGKPAGALALLRISKTSPTVAAADTDTLAAFVSERPEPCWIADKNGAPVWVNRAWLATVGAHTLAEARERRLTLDAEADRIAIESARSGEVRSLLRWVRAGDQRRALRFRAQPLEGGAGVWSEDVTEVESAAVRLSGQEAAQAAIFDLVADAIAVFDPDRRLNFYNAGFARLWALEPAWLAERPFHGELLDRLRRHGRLPQQGDYARFKAAELARHEALANASETIWRLQDERTIKVASRPNPRGGLIMVFSDVTPELRLRSQFNHLLQVQQATLDKLSDAVAVFGPDARLSLHNEAFEAFWSVTAAQLPTGLEFDSLVELVRWRLHDLQFWRDLKGRITDPDPAARAPVLCEVATADRRIVAHQSRPLPDGATLIGFVDITDTRQLEQALSDREAALHETERLKREFVGSVSYELRTPLTTILGYAELLERERDGLDPRSRGHLTSIRVAGAQLARSIDNVLDMAQFDAGDVAPDMGDVDVAALVRSAGERWESMAREAGVALEVGPGADLGLMRGDAGRLNDMIDHLMENALRHTPSGGSVTLSAERALGEVRLQVSDTGRGIPFHVQAHIFDRFSGHDRASSGLGLPLVKALVELHGGWVSLESEPGAGATFTCHLPEAAEAPEARPELF